MEGPGFFLLHHGIELQGQMDEDLDRNVDNDQEIRHIRTSSCVKDIREPQQDKRHCRNRTELEDNS